MIRPDFPSLLVNWCLAGRVCASVSLLMMLCALVGCSWMQRKPTREQEVCREFLESSILAQQSGDIRKARGYLEDAASMHPNHAETWWNLAEISVQQESPNNAIQELKRYIELQPKDPQGHLRLAQLYYLQNRYELADEQLKFALKLSPQNFDAALLAARLALKRSGPQQATAAYYRALHLHPGHAQATLELAELLIARQESDRAAAMLRDLSHRSLNQEHEHRIHLNLGIAYGQNGRWDNAVEHLTRAREATLDPNPRDHYRLAYAHWKAGESQQSLKLLLELADAGQWDTRADALFSKLTEYSSQELHSDRLLMARYEPTAPFLPDRLVSAENINSDDLIPPEWAHVE